MCAQLLSGMKCAEEVVTDNKRSVHPLSISCEVLTVVNHSRDSDTPLHPEDTPTSHGEVLPRDAPKHYYRQRSYVIVCKSKREYLLSLQEVCYHSNRYILF